MPYKDKEKQNKFNIEWKNKRRDKWIEDNGGKCVICGSTKDLEIDHIDPSTKEFSINSLWTRKEELRIKELAKCQILCKECHIKKTREEQTVGHGGGNAGIKNCNCELCLPKRREYDKLRKRRRRKLGFRS